MDKPYLEVLPAKPDPAKVKRIKHAQLTTIGSFVSFVALYALCAWLFGLVDDPVFGELASYAITVIGVSLALALFGVGLGIHGLYKELSPASAHRRP